MSNPTPAPNPLGNASLGIASSALVFGIGLCALTGAEGGCTTRPVGPIPGTPDDQVAYLKAIHGQLGRRLDFWVYLLLNDFNLDSYAELMNAQGQGGDIETLGMFSSVGLREFDGTPKPALEVWDTYRNNP